MSDNGTYAKIGRVQPIHKGKYNNEAEYELNHVVTYNGSLYWHSGKEPTTGIPPTDTSVWTLSLDGAYIPQMAEEAQNARDEAVEAKEETAQALEEWQETYDPAGKKQDIFAYTDDAVEAERNRAAGAEGVLRESIELEASRAQGVERTLQGDVDKNKTAINVLNGSAETEGSVSYQIALAVEKIMNNPDDTLNSIQELVNWINSHATDAAAIVAGLDQAKRDIDALEEKVGSESVAVQISKALTAELAKYATTAQLSSVNSNATSAYNRASQAYTLANNAANTVQQITNTTIPNAKQQAVDEAKVYTDGQLGNYMKTAEYDPNGIGGSIYELIQNSVSAKRYGVSGVGGATTALTRLWDAVGLEAMVSTDEVDPDYHNDFDDIAPFNRRKCVGHWEMVIPSAYPKAKFVVESYYGDPDYAEDGTKGDYVAVEVEPLWYYQDLVEGIIGVSPAPVASKGWKPHPVCLDRDNQIRQKTYLPCYALAQKDGKAVSLPGLYNVSGNYKGLWDICRTYNDAAMLEPMAVRHYEWLLFTIEYATTNAQSKMQGASSMAYANTAIYQATVATTGETDNNRFILANSGASDFVVGQTLAMSASAQGETYKRIITAIETYDDANKALVFDGEALNVPVGWYSSSRPWQTGACNDVQSPSGSPVSNASGKYPMRYRYRENVWGNQYSTCGDLVARLEGVGTTDDPYTLGWYHLTDPAYYPSATSKPDATDLEIWVKLGQTTEHVSGYIKEIQADENYPHCIVPVVQTGASSGTYFSDYAYIVNGTVGIRGVRLGGILYNGSYDGPLCFAPRNAVSTAHWTFGGGLYMDQ